VPVKIRFSIGVLEAMARSAQMAKPMDYSAIFTSDITALKASIETFSEVLNVMDWALESALEELESNGHLSSEQSLLKEYQQAIELLRQRGFRRTQDAREAVSCPGCKALLKDVSGAKGDRCSWCGYVFK